MALPQLNLKTQDIDYDNEVITFNTDEGIFELKISNEAIFRAVFEDVFRSGGQLIATETLEPYDPETGDDEIIVYCIQGEYIYTGAELHQVLKDNIDKVTVDQDEPTIGTTDDINPNELQNGITL